MKAELLQYDVRHDRHEKDIRFISKQLETHLRERFNVLLSTVEYGIKNGHLVRQGAEEPFIESIKRGRDIIQRLSPNTIDVEREDAEVTGFEKIDAFLSNPATPLGSKMLSVSPEGGEGSKYQHNFYDIFTLKEVRGQRFVELSRYSSGLTSEEYAQRLGAKFKHPPQAHPIEFDVRVTVKQIHRELHKEHEYMDTSKFEEEIWASPLVQYCAQVYEMNPNPCSFNAFLNAADEVLDNNKRKEQGQIYRDYSINKPSYGDIRQLEKKEVRQAGGQCPGKSGADADDSPFSVSEFTQPDKYGERTFECPECGKTNIRPKDELLKNCQHCGSPEVAC